MFAVWKAGEISSEEVRCTYGSSMLDRLHQAWREYKTLTGLSREQDELMVVVDTSGFVGWCFWVPAVESGLRGLPLLAVAALGMLRGMGRHQKEL